MMTTHPSPARQNSGVPDARPFVSVPPDDADSCICVHQGSSPPYRLAGDDAIAFTRFTLTVGDVSRPAYRLHPKAASAQETPWHSCNPPTNRAVAWLLAHTFPAVSAEQTFALAGTRAPDPLTDNDAYAAVQGAIWLSCGAVSTANLQYSVCAEDTPPESTRLLRAAALRLARLAAAHLDAPDAPPPATGRDAAECYCADNPAPDVPYFVITGDACTASPLPDGRLRIGPFTLRAAMSGTPTLTLVPLFGNDPMVFTFSDLHGNPLDAPALDEAFYLLLRTSRRFACCRLCATLSSAAARIVFAPSPEESGVLAAALPSAPYTVCTALQICALNFAAWLSFAMGTPEAWHPQPPPRPAAPAPQKPSAPVPRPRLPQTEPKPPLSYSPNPQTVFPRPGRGRRRLPESLYRPGFCQTAWGRP